MIYVLVIMFQRMDPMQLPCKTTTDFKHWVAATCPETPPLETTRAVHRVPNQGRMRESACQGEGAGRPRAGLMDGGMPQGPCANAGMTLS